ncbi:MAG: hypothetical protein KDC80_23205 [Saprospiraceae bacterium]|nr:hypothetical protein [Saprospiraceae bacterium]
MKIVRINVTTKYGLIFARLYYLEEQTRDGNGENLSQGSVEGGLHTVIPHGFWHSMQIEFPMDNRMGGSVIAPSPNPGNYYHDSNPEER